jgi:hypothetical protein
MTVPIGWYVRVRTGEIVDGVYDTVLYIAGYPTLAEAEAAVRNVRSKSDKQFKYKFDPKRCAVFSPA